MEFSTEGGSPARGGQGASGGEDGTKINLPAPRQVFSVYVIRCENGSFYIGQTEDLLKRWQEHKEGRVGWTKKNKPLEVIHYEEFESRDDAVKRERELKTGFGRKWLKREYKKKRLKPWSENAARQAGIKDLDYKLIKPLIWWE